MPGPKKRTEPTPEQATIVARYRAGEGATAIAASLGIARRSIYNALDLAGVARKREMHSLTPEQEAEVVRRYQGGEPVLQISRDFPEVHLVTVHNVVKRHLGGPRPELAKPRVPEEDREYAITLCREGRKVREVAEILRTSEKTIERILKEARDRGEVVDMPQGRPPSCLVDHDAFDEPSPASDYWTGFLFADGCIHKDRYGAPAVIVGLSEKDRAHVEKFRAFLGSTHAIIRTPAKIARGIGHFADLEIRTGPCVYFRVRSERLAQALRERGMSSKNDDRCPIPRLAASRDFWRGAVDGDGWVSERDYGRIGFCGYPTVIEAFVDYFHSITGTCLTPRPAPKSDKILVVEASNRPARHAIEVLYRDAPATTSLDRKHASARRVF